MRRTCIIYVRSAAVEQGTPRQHRHDVQEAQCRQYAKADELTVLDVLRDAGYSGRTTDRPGFRRLMKSVGRKIRERIDTILVSDTTRMPATPWPLSGSVERSALAALSWLRSPSRTGLY
jgi:DNA invertase Pin-like site-specific DNA recombinase